MDKEPATQSEEDTTESDSESNDEAEVQKPKRKRPSDYIAKKDRPENLKSDKKINQLSLDEAIEICKLSAKRCLLKTGIFLEMSMCRKKIILTKCEWECCQTHLTAFMDIVMSSLPILTCCHSLYLVGNKLTN